MSEADAELFESDLVRTASDGALFAYDVPAFVRRGQDVESLLASLNERCRKRRMSTIDMVHMRLRQWAAVAVGPHDWADVFSKPIELLWPASEAAPPVWGVVMGSTRNRKKVARELIAGVNRFNARWIEYVGKLNLDLVNRSIEDYNKYYLIEKECLLGSARLASMHFTPIPTISTESLLCRYPILPVPQRGGL